MIFEKFLCQWEKGTRFTALSLILENFFGVNDTAGSLSANPFHIVFGFRASCEENLPE
jgi:hypothetical protein